MSMMLYGAVKLLNDQLNSKKEVMNYWHQLEIIHGLHLIFNMPTNEYLEESIRNIWISQDWIRFTIVGMSNEDKGTSDHFLMQSAIQGQSIKAILKDFPVNSLWTRVIQWRFLYFMFWHNLLTEGYLVIEHTSGESANIAEKREICLTDAISDIWSKYCWDMSYEDPSIYHFDLSILPR